MTEIMGARGAAASRTWGHGAVNWQALNAQVTVPNRAPSQRRVLVSYTAADAEGRIKPRVASRFPVAKTKKALQAMEKRETIGRVIVTFD